MTNTSQLALRPHRLILLVLLAVLGCSVAFAQAGSDGRTVITQKDVPFVIKRPGSYVLGSNLIVSNPNVTAITVNASNVTIDLAGFAIIGPSVGPTGQGSGILANYPNVAVSNGTVRGFYDPAASCVSLGGDSKAEDLRVLDCPRSGIFVANGIVRGCQVSFSGVGIGVYGASLVTNNTLFHNTQAGLNLVNNLIGGSTVIGNNFRDISGYAIYVDTAGNRIEGNTLTNNAVGIHFEVGAGNFLARNFLQGNTANFDGVGGYTDGSVIDAALTNLQLP